jgi:hypothetical protein
MGIKTGTTYRVNVKESKYIQVNCSSTNHYILFTEFKIKCFEKSAKKKLSKGH